MLRYQYRFTWRDKVSKKYQRYFAEAASMEEAIAEFEAEKDVSVADDAVKVFRMFG